MKLAIALVLIAFLLFGCLQSGQPTEKSSPTPVAPAQPTVKKPTYVLPDNISNAKPPADQSNSIKNATPVVVPKNQTAPRLPAQAISCKTDNCTWAKVVYETDSKLLQGYCSEMTSAKEKDVCTWYAAGITQNNSLCNNFADAKYSSSCIMESNGQLTCSPSDCEYCISKDSCLEYITCDYNASWDGKKCRQASLLHNPLVKIESPVPPRVVLIDPTLTN